MTYTPSKSDYVIDSRGKQTAITSGEVVVVGREVVNPAIAGLPPYLRLFPVKEQDAKA